MSGTHDPSRSRAGFTHLFGEIARVLTSYLSGQLRIALIMAALYGIGFAFLKVPAWALVAILCGLLNTVPLFGTPLAMLLAVGLTWAGGGDIWKIGWVLGVFLVVQTIEGYYLTPRILGSRLGLRPLTVFFSLLVGGALFGFLGLLLAVPVLAVANVFVKFFGARSGKVISPAGRNGAVMDHGREADRF